MASNGVAVGLEDCDAVKGEDLEKKGLAINLETAREVEVKEGTGGSSRLDEVGYYSANSLHSSASGSRVSASCNSLDLDVSGLKEPASKSLPNSGLFWCGVVDFVLMIVAVNVKSCN